MAVSRADIIAAYEMILQRAPESEDAIAYHLGLGFNDRYELGHYMCAIEEFRVRIDPMLAEGRSKYRPMSMFLGDRVLTETHRGQKIYLAPGDVDLTPHILWTGKWEGHVESATLNLLRPGHHVADIGANVGYYTLAMGNAVGRSGSVHAIEANPELTPLLRASVYLNALSDWVRVHNVAAMDAPGKLILASAPGHSGSGHIGMPSDGASEYDKMYAVRVEVEGVRIDDLLGPDQPPLDMIRMDIEGAEPQALRGASALIARSSNLRIVTEWSMGMMAARTDVPAFIDWLSAQGFRFWLVRHLGQLEPIDRDGLLNLPHSDVVIARDLGV